MYIRPRGSNVYTCSFPNQRYSQQSVDRCQLLPTNVKHLEPTNPWEVFVNSWTCFIKRPCLNFCFYPVSIACLKSEIDTGEKYPLRSKKLNHVGAYFCMGAYKHGMVVFMGVLILCGCLLSRFYGISISGASGILPVGVVMCTWAGEHNEAAFSNLSYYTKSYRITVSQVVLVSLLSCPNKPLVSMCSE